MSYRSLGHRAPLLWLVLPFIGGLGIGKISGISATPWLLTLAALSSAGAIVAAGRSACAWAALLVVAMVCAGSASYALHRVRLPAWDVLPPREARIALQVDRVFASNDPRRASGLATVTRTDAHLGDLLGQRIYFSLNLRKGERAPLRSSRIGAVGILVTLPRSAPADTFDGFLVGAGMNFRFSRGRVVAEEKKANAYYRAWAAAADRFHAVLGLGIAEKRPALAGLLRAMMLGQTHELSDEQEKLFMQSGTMHLFAISGLNIGVIATALQALLLLLRLSTWPRFLIGIALLWAFVEITGAAPSAVRAFAMAAFVQMAFVLRRPANVLAGLIASAFLVLLASPLQVFSASFLMSYTIVAALLVLGLPLGDAWLERYQPWRHLPEVGWSSWQRGLAAAWRMFATSLAIGIATTLVSLVTGVQFFQLLTPGALAANLVLIPAAVVVTLGGFASLICGLVAFTPGVVLCNHAAALVIWAIESLVRLSVKVPGVFVTARFTADWVASATLIALLATLLFGYANRWAWRRGGWLPPFAVVGFALILGVSYE